MALLSASDFTGYSDSFAAPAGFNGPIFAGSVDLILSTGLTQQVFDTLSSAPKCIHDMEANNLYSLGPNEDVTVLNLRSKLLILRKCLYQSEKDEFIGLYLSWCSSKSYSPSYG